MRQRETEDIAARGHRDKLYTIHGVTHWRRAYRLAGVEVPQLLARARVDCFEGIAIVAKEQHSPSGSQRPAPGFSRAYLGVTPDCFTVGR